MPKKFGSHFAALEGVGTEKEFAGFAGGLVIDAFRSIPHIAEEEPYRQMDGQAGGRADYHDHADRDRAQRWTISRYNIQVML